MLASINLRILHITRPNQYSANSIFHISNSVLTDEYFYRPVNGRMDSDVILQMAVLYILTHRLVFLLLLVTSPTLHVRGLFARRG
jgi:hypothetical protein